MQLARRELGRAVCCAALSQGLPSMSRVVDATGVKIARYAASTSFCRAAWPETSQLREKQAPAAAAAAPAAAASEALEAPAVSSLASADLATITINNKTITVPKGVPILEAAERLGIHIPSLCAHPSLPATPGTCRLCNVDVGGGRLQPACATPVWDGMKVQTDTPRVVDSVRGVLSLMKANHPADCMNCDVSGRCEFQDLVSRYSVDRAGDLRLPKLASFSSEWAEEMREGKLRLHDESSKAISIDLEKCLRCGRCVTACGAVQGMNVLGWQARSRERHPEVVGEVLDESKCIECGQCSVVCPVGAIVERSEWREVMDELASKRKVMVCMTAPSVRVAIGEEVGLAPGVISTGQMVTAQRELGFDYVFDVTFGADLTIMEEGAELLQRVKHAIEASSERWQQVQGSGASGATAGAANGEAEHEEGRGHHDPGPLPMFTSCCPGWVNLVEKSYPELIPHLSTCKSPQGMHGAIVKRYVAPRLGVRPEDICLVSVMPCVAKKHEAEREEMQREGEGRDVDYVLTTREFGHMLRERRIPLASLPESQFDSPLGEGSGAGQIFGNTGGVMEAALRTAYEVAAGEALPKLEIEDIRGLAGVKSAAITIPGTPAAKQAGLAGQMLRVAVRLEGVVASGIGNARHLLQAMERGEAPAYHFVEVMACPGGCIGGGGQPKTKDPLAVLKRMKGIYSIDERATLRKSHENESIKELYKTYLGEPGSRLSHAVLHTTYTDRSRATVPPQSHHEGQAEHEAADIHLTQRRQQQQAGGGQAGCAYSGVRKASS